ncbi:MAG: hypothetical protein IJB52_07435, partial [Clostridia bacterium]|nr:hypothetical protein [Clostridia bacterium]
MHTVDLLESVLSERDKIRLQSIYAPAVVCVQPDDARRGLYIMPDGEIRSYGVTDKKGPHDAGRYMYLSSRNCGLDWNRVDLPEGTAPVINYGKIFPGTVVMGAATQAPWSGRYICLVGIHEGEQKGTWAMLSDTGPGDTAPKMVQIAEEVFIDMFLPTVLE